MAASTLIFYSSFLSLIFLSIAMITFHTFLKDYDISKRLCLQREWFSDDNVVWFTKKNIALKYILVKIHEVVKVNIWWTIKFDLLNLFFAWIFHDKVVSWIYSVFWWSKTRLYNKNTINFYFLAPYK